MFHNPSNNDKSLNKNKLLCGLLNDPLNDFEDSCEAMATSKISQDPTHVIMQRFGFDVLFSHLNFETFLDKLMDQLKDIENVPNSQMTTMFQKKKTKDNLLKNYMFRTMQLITPLLFKEMFYPYIKEKCDLFSIWLEEHKLILNKEEFNRYINILDWSKEIKGNFESQNDTDDEKIQTNKCMKLIELIFKADEFGELLDVEGQPFNSFLASTLHKIISDPIILQESNENLSRVRNDWNNKYLPIAMENISSMLGIEKLYPFVKEQCDLFPKWLEEHESTLNKEQFDWYTKILDCVKEIRDNLESQNNTGDKIQIKMFKDLLVMIIKLNDIGQPLTR